MKKMISFMVVVVCLWLSSPVLAGEAGEDAVASPQVQFTIGHLFGENEDVKGFAFGIFMYNMANDYPIGLGYAGPMFTVGQANIYVLGALMIEPAGTSAGFSGWFEYKGLFLEYDHFESWMPASHDEGAVAPPTSYYGLIDYGHSLKNDVTLGVAYEVVGFYEDDKPFEMAYGPYIQFKNFKIWMAYDETPNVPSYDYWLIRFKFGI
ncbi:hypothetical protein ACFL2U_03905 [Patescibacteria group bacterium]